MFQLRKSADPSRRVVAIILCKIQTLAQNPKSKIQNPKSKIQNPRSKIRNPKSKIQTAAFGAATKRTDTRKFQNPKSKIRNPKSKIQDPKSKIQNPKSKTQDPTCKIQKPKSKIQNPKSKIQNPSLDLRLPGWGRRRWVCRKCSCMGGLATRIWRSWWGPKLVSKRSGLAPPARVPNWAPISRGGFCWKPGSDFHPGVVETWAQCPEKISWKMMRNMINISFKRSLQISLMLFLLKLRKQSNDMFMIFLKEYRYFVVSKKWHLS